MEIIWRSKARVQLRQIFDYHKRVASLRTAHKILRQIESTVFNLSTFPNMGPIEYTLKELPYTFRSIVVHPNYKVIYLIENAKIHIVSIWDCRQAPCRMKENL